MISESRLELVAGRGYRIPMHLLALRFLRRTLLLLALAWCAISANAQSPASDPLKTDLMGVFAHPDDETGVASTLAYYALGQGKVVANVYCTRGEGGGNMVGTQSGAALGILREVELRACLEKLGIRLKEQNDAEILGIWLMRNHKKQPMPKTKF